MRFLFRTRYGEPAPHRALIALVAILGALVALGVFLRQSPLMTRKPSASVSTPASAAFAKLPRMSVALAGGANVADVRVTLELAPALGGVFPASAAPRIADRVGDRLRLVEMDQLQGSDGARLVKSAVQGAVTDEVGPGSIRAVLIDSLIVY